MSSRFFGLTGKVAIVTGSTKGMGESIAEQFAASGARVVVTSRNAEECAETAERLNARYGAGNVIAVFQAGELNSKSDQQAIVARAVETFGSITTLVCSPTIQPWFGPSLDIPEEELDRQYVHIFKTRFWITNMCIPHMARAGGGSVVYIGSGSAFEANVERNTYACMRAAEVQMMRNFAAEFGGDNIRFNIISPALIESSGAQSLFADKGTVAGIVQGLPMGRRGTRSEISNAANFLASDASSFTTGAVLPVDGGRNLHVRTSRMTKAFAKEQAARMSDTDTTSS